MILEVCVDSLRSLEIAREAGADRIELCSALNLGGLTPSYGLMKEASKIKDIEIVIMIRPRSGDFLYNKEEFETMKNDIGLAKEMGFSGIVTGILREDGKIDLKRMEDLAQLVKPLDLVLHRAFDDAHEPEKDIPALIDIGLIRILTSGQRETALAGADYIGEIQKDFGDKITIMPGAGINEENIRELYERTNCNNYHMSGRANIGSQMVYRDYIKRMKTPREDLILEEANYENIKKLRKILDYLARA